jgi:hypothetical protein
MPRSTASGRFAHDGANNEKGNDSSGESDHESASAPSGLAADQGPSIPLFPPSVIAPFTALSLAGPAMASTSTPSLVYDSSSPAPPPSSSSAPPIPSSSVISSSSMHASSSSSSFPSALATPVHPPPPSSSSLNASESRSAGKRKQSSVPDLDEHGSVKRRGPRTSGSKPQPVETAILHGFQGSMNHFSNIVQLNNENQPHTILKDANLKLNGPWGAADKFTDGQKIVLLKLFRKDQAIASLYASTESSRIRRGYALSELEPYKDEIDDLDREEPEENNDDDSMYL